MAKKIRLIDDTVETVGDAAIAPLTESPKGDTIGSAFSKDDVEKLMKTAEAIDWKLWELLKFTQKFEDVMLQSATSSQD
jgi:hypothetical protein|tara:strand:- start:691 stop:927 length:237 start_codon:yes stop_codon:yes gene_type:complete